MKQIIRAFLIMQKVITAVISIALTAMIAVVFLQTFCRFVIFKSLSWSEELSRYLFVAVIVLGVNLAMSNHMMVRIEIIDNYLKGKAAVVMNLVRRFAALFVNIIFMYSAFKLIEIGGYQTSPAMSIPMSFLYSIILVGFVLNVLAALMDIYQTYVRQVSGKEEK
ncbi:TRAP transporter small permease [Brotaphodocola catenula]|uniref:TRAP transporter small permease n=1 Tax=Brotaphodocola catenula TaxID=2885361 RepID=A0AAE3ANI5_9FIRM|nr:TRAP transporter small permease [Brotaphodocola catenula]MCC2163735.1 TRAP transporter small permease [Brotaphodocola catenula]